MFDQVLIVVQTLAMFIAICISIYVPLKFNAKLNKYDMFISRYMTSLGNKSGETKQVKKAEKMVMGDLMNSQFPEAELIMSALSGETKAYLEENPHVVPHLIARYAPIIKQLAGQFSGANEQLQKYDL